MAAMITKPAVTTIFSASASQNSRSGDISSCSACAAAVANSVTATVLLSHPLHLDVDRRPLGDGLVDHAIALGQLEQLIELVLRDVGRNVEAQPDGAEADRRILGDAERAAKIEIALRRHRPRLQW